MTVSRWKVMAGVLGVSLGGLAALAGQSPKTSDARRADPPSALELPMPTAPKAAALAPAVDVPPPYHFSLPTTAPATLPALPLLSEPPLTAKPPKPDVIPVSGFSLPGVPVVSAGGPTPPPLLLPTPAVQIDPLLAKPTPAPTPPFAAFPVDVKLPLSESPLPVVRAGVEPPPVIIGIPSGGPPITPAASVADHAAPIRVAPAAAVAAAATKFRIILRVGEGDPTFEVRSGDDMLMKVACEKVDIASAEKGQPMQQVRASGKVRFVGFGSEGTCDELSFLAGTGELQLTGNVTIQVKDKLGRVDSELKSDKVKYKLDASALPGVMKP